MQISEIITFWRDQQKSSEEGIWAHKLDREVLVQNPHSFNLDHPVSPYVGDVANAKVIILGANGGYDPNLTPSEFPNSEAVSDYVTRVNNPAAADWTFVSQYYDHTNYGNLIADGRAVLVNACAYRSRKISEEPDNRAMMKRLCSVAFTRQWLLEAVLPMANKGERMIVAKRHGQWKLPLSFRDSAGVVFDPAPISPQITRKPYSEIIDFLAGGQRS